jgi:hypothetical protein
VLSIDFTDDEKSMEVMFGGSFTGTFQMQIRHTEYGLIDTTDMFLDVSSTVTSISPSTGSIHGGTLITITGTNFGTVPTDNPVQISESGGGVGNMDCYV